MRIKRHFTMIELLVVLSILAVASVLVGFSIQQALKDQRFRSEVNAVTKQLRTAQDLMLFASAEAYVKFAMDPEGRLNSWIEVKSKIPPFLEKQVKLSHQVFTTLKKIEFYDFKRNGTPLTQFEIEYGFRGTHMSRGTLRLWAEDDASWVREIDLTGTPEPIVAHKSDLNFKENTQEGVELYERLTQNIQLQFPESDPLRSKPAETQPQNNIKDEVK